VLERIAADAGLTPERTFDFTWAFDYADEEELTRSMLSVAGLAVLAGPAREREVCDAIVEGLAPYRTETGGYRLQNEYHYVIARA
jgi:hypothetical protein